MEVRAGIQLDQLVVIHGRKLEAGHLMVANKKPKTTDLKVDFFTTEKKSVPTFLPQKKKSVPFEGGFNP